MAGNTCFLCGDRLVNGYCTSCGFSNKRAMKIRYRMNPSESVERINGEKYKKSIKEQIRDTAWREEKKKSLAKQLEGELNIAAVQKRPEEKQRRINTNYQKRTNSPKSTVQKANSFKAGLAIVAVVVGLFAGPIGSLFSSYKEETNQGYEVTDTEWGDDQDISYALSEDGENWEKTLGMGNYEVGVDIPEGRYNVSLVEGNGGFVIQDDNHYNYDYEYFGSESPDSMTEMGDVELFEGSLVSVTFSAQLRLESDNAQIDAMYGMENPLTEERTLEENKSYQVGVDIPEGIYDVQRLGEQAMLNYEIPSNKDFYDTGYMEDSVFLPIDNPDDVYHKVILPKGTIVSAQMASVKLIPSATIGSDDYASYYRDYREE